MISTAYIGRLLLLIMTPNNFMSRLHRSFLWKGVGVIAILSLIAGCGGGDDETEDGSPIDPGYSIPYDTYHKPGGVARLGGASDAELRAEPDSYKPSILVQERGEFNVDSSGNSTYSYKIDLPPSINDRKPELSIEYNSAKRWGPLRMGWSIKGISEITKCRAELEKDGFIEGVSRIWSERQRLCLDGEPLVMISGSSYGEDGSEYVLEIKSDIRVKAFGSRPAGPEYFELKNGAGETQRFGISRETRLEGNDGVTYAWKIAEAIDLSGNIIHYQYKTVGGDMPIQFISYRGKTEKDRTVRVYFEWEDQFNYKAWITEEFNGFQGFFDDRNQPILYSGGGLLFSNSQRLSDISVSVATAPFSSYEFNYEGVYGRENRPFGNLKSIQKCSPICIGVACSNVCSDPIEFEWEHRAVNTNQADSCGFSYAGSDTDFFGGMPAFTSKYKISNPLTDDFSWGNSNYHSHVLGDFNNDRLMDVSVMYTYGEGERSILEASIAYSDGEGGFTPESREYSATIGDRQLNHRLSADLNNDGYADIIATNTSESGWNSYVALNNGDGTFSDPVHQKVSDANFIHQKSFKKITGDFNGDGHTDLMAFGIGHGNNIEDSLFSRISGLVAYVALGNGDGTFQSAKGGQVVKSSELVKSLKTERALFVGDFNGDGISDIASVYVNDSTEDFGVFLGHETVVAFGTEDGTFKAPIISTGILQKDRKYSRNLSEPFADVSDVNGDGISDIVVYSGGVAFHTMSFIGRGDGTFSVTEWAHAPSYYPSPDFVNHPIRDCDTSHSSYIVADFNGDGFADISSGTLFFYLGVGNGSFITQGAMKMPGDAIQKAGGGLNIDGIYQTDTTYGAYAFDTNRDGNLDVVEVVVSGNGLRVGTYPYAERVNQQYLTKITEGKGQRIEIEYEPIDSGENYTIGNSSVFPEKDVGTGRTVVRRVGMSNPKGRHHYDFEYHELVGDMRQKKLLGFKKIVTRDSRNGLERTSLYEHRFPLSGHKHEETVRSDKGVLLQKTTSNIDYEEVSVLLGNHTHKHYVLSPLSTTSEDFNTDGEFIGMKTVTFSDHDDFGEPGQIHIESSDGYSTTSVSTLESNLSWSEYYASRITRIEESKSSSEYPEPVINIKEIVYYDKGMVHKEIIEPDDADLRLEHAFEYNGFGQLIGRTISGDPTAKHPVETRRESYDITLARGGQFSGRNDQMVVEITNFEGQVRTERRHRAHGKILQMTDENGLVTEYQRTETGEIFHQKNPDLSTVAYTLSECNFICPATATHRLLVSDSKHPNVEIYYNFEGKPVRKRSIGMNGETILIEMKYDSMGRLAEETRPFYIGTTHTRGSSFEYDDLNRLLKSQTPESGTTEYRYVANNGGGAAVIKTQMRYGRSARETITYRQDQDLSGRPIDIVDGENAAAELRYDGAGRLRSIKDPHGNEITMTYDPRGRKQAINDPDSGLIQLEVDAIGSTRYRKDAEGNEFDYVYDKLNRLVMRTSAEGVDHYIFDDGDFAVGKIAMEISASGSSKAYTYNDRGELFIETHMIDGNELSFVNSYKDSRLHTLTYPSGLTVTYNYNEFDHLASVASDGAVYWEAEEMYANGTIKSELYGNGVTTKYTKYAETGKLAGIVSSTSGSSMMAIQDATYVFDTLGNLSSRSDKVRGVTEGFTYDRANRLREEIINGDLFASTTYNDIGNITSKTDFASTYNYGENGAGPRSLSSVTLPGGQSLEYAYDKNGNMISGAGRAITYTSFNKASRVASGASVVDFTYDAHRERVMKIQGATKTLYVNPGWSGGPSYEQVIRPGTGNKEHRHYISALGAPVAIHKTTENPDGSNIYYLHKDHLGSVSVITGDLGAIVEELSYSPFGERRLTESGGAPTGSITSRGYTGHEHIEGSGLVNMNARLYDPKLGRFLSADNFLPDIANIESINRYTYAHNNPLSLTDPTGNSPMMGGAAPSGIAMDGFGNSIMRVLVVVTGTKPGASAGSISSNHNARASGGISQAGNTGNANASPRLHANQGVSSRFKTMNEVDSYFTHSKEVSAVKTAPYPMPESTRNALSEIMSSPIGDKIRHYGRSIEISMSRSIKDSFVASGDSLILYTTDVAAWVDTQKTRVEGDGVDSATLSILLAHEIGHIIGGKGAPTQGTRANEIWTVVNFENPFRAHVGAPMRTSYMEVGDVPVN